jgi:hypothetical protein
MVDLLQGIGSSDPDDGVLVAESLHQTGHQYILIQLDLELVAAVELNGILEYQITTEGMKAIARHPELPELRDKTLCINNRYLQDFYDIEQRQDIGPPTKKALVDARDGQGRFRKQVLKSWGNCCSVTGSSTLLAIKASHIKPWRESSDAERLDPNNGLPLIASLDSLFDSGLISFDPSGKLLVSPKLTRTEREIFGINERSLRKKPTAKMTEYLKYHCATHGFKP